MKVVLKRTLALALAFALGVTGSIAEGVTDARLKAAEGDRTEWLHYGRDYGQQRFSPLDQVNGSNV